MKQNKKNLLFSVEEGLPIGHSATWILKEKCLANGNLNLFFLIQIYDMVIKIYLQVNVTFTGKNG